MADVDTLAKIRELVGSADVAKTPTPDPTPAEDTLSLDDVAKAIGAVHTQSTAAVDELATQTREGFETVGKAFQELVAEIRAQPQGRRSVARAGAPEGLATRAEVAKTAPSLDPTAVDETQLEEEIAKTTNLRDALKVFNKHTYGIGE